MSAQKKNGFTLLELLIAISIIAIISAVGITTFSTSQKLSRDTKRKQDLRSIAVALELYYQKNKHYPCTTDWEYSDPTPSFWFSNNLNLSPANCGGSSPAFDTNFINQIPIDPLANTNAPPWTATPGVNNYGYGYWSGTQGSCTVPGQYYMLITLLENADDKERIGSVDQTYKCTNQTFAGALAMNPRSFIITSN